jgi:sugar/nucleoside kinase (ribokinase family)
MCSDRGVAASLLPDEMDALWFEDCEHLHVSGYALLRDPIRHAAVRAIALAREAGARISVDLSSWSAIRDFGSSPFRALLVEVAPDVVFANADEEVAVGGPIPGTCWIVKRGAEGAIFDGEERAALPVSAVVDSTGAGDAFAAGWLLGGPDLALAAASRCVQQVGSMPYTID